MPIASAQQVTVKGKISPSNEALAGVRGDHKRV